MLVEFNGLPYYRNKRGYYTTPPKIDRQGRSGRLHRDIYAAVNGPIPDGFDVHHDDGDLDNNQPSNLIALSRVDHLLQHPKVPYARTQKAFTCNQCGRDFTAKWSGTNRWCSPACRSLAWLRRKKAS